MAKRIRDAISGRFLQRYEAMPDTSVEETVSTAPRELADLRFRVGAMRAAMGLAAGDLRNMVMHKSLTEERISEVASRLEEAARRGGEGG